LGLVFAIDPALPTLMRKGKTKSWDGKYLSLNNCKQNGYRCSPEVPDEALEREGRLRFRGSGMDNRLGLLALVGCEKLRGRLTLQSSGMEAPVATDPRKAAPATRVARAGVGHKLPESMA
jgi:hypothetical protein